jgi:hypothetical protein
MQIIKLERKRLQPDPFIAPNPGNWGSCMLCGSYSKLTEAHVPPQNVGNAKAWTTRSWVTALSAKNRETFYPRHFKGGLKFKTLCKDCNGGLGGQEDKALGDFYERVTKLVESSILMGAPIVKLAAKPNLIYRALLAHLVSANDSGIPCSFDDEVREIFSGKRALRDCTWNLFYWLYLGDNLFVMRNVYYMMWHPRVILRPMFILKLYPLAFLLTQESWFVGCPNARKFLCRSEEEEVELPLQVFRCDLDPVWPAMASDKNMLMAGGSTFGLVGWGN